jgi:hypothetical protein
MLSPENCRGCRFIEKSLQQIMNCPEFYLPPEEEKPCLRSKALSKTAGEYTDMVDGKPGQKEEPLHRASSSRRGKR